MKRLTSLILLAVAGTAQPLQAQNIINPFALLAPNQGNPWSGGYGNLSSPFGLGALNPLNPLNSINPLSPWNNYGGLSNPVLSLGALGALNALTPSLPGSNPFNNSPYGGSSFPANPFASSQQQQYSTPAFSPSLPSLPNMPFAVQQQNMMPGGYYPVQQPGYFMPYGMQQPPQPSLGNFFGLPQQPVQRQPSPGYFFGTPQQPAQQQPPQTGFFGNLQQPVQQRQPVQQQPSVIPNLFGMMQPAQPAAQPAQPTQSPAQQTSPGLPFPWQQPTQAQPPAPQPAAPASDPPKAAAPQAPQPFMLPFFFSPAPAPAAPVVDAPRPAAAVPEAKAEAAGTLAPLDPAAFIQMYMKPQ